MRTPEPAAAALTIVPAAPEEAPVLANLLELYSHDFSDFADLRPGPDGRFGYPALPLYWTEGTRFPFLVRIAGDLAGFVLVSRGSPVCDDPAVFDVNEFFVLRGCRKRGIGTAVAHEVWRRFPGRWNVRVTPENELARRFWSAAIEAFTGSAAESVLTEVQQRQWHVFSFRSPGGS
jgi:predicted acetyltransferase